jgi:hypothetical protein
VLSEKTGVNQASCIQNVYQRISIFTKRRGIDYELIALGEPLQKEFGTWSHQNEHLADLSFYLYREDDIWLLGEWGWLETRMDQGLIQVKC